MAVPLLLSATPFDDVIDVFPFECCFIYKICYYLPEDRTEDLPEDEFSEDLICSSVCSLKAW